MVKKFAVATDAETPIEIASYMSVDVTVVKRQRRLTELSKQQQTLITKDDQNNTVKSKDYR